MEQDNQNFFEEIGNEIEKTQLLDFVKSILIGRKLIDAHYDDDLELIFEGNIKMKIDRKV